MRKPVIAGNWKMYKTPAEAQAYLDAFLPLVAGHTRDQILLFPSITSLATALAATAGSNVSAGAQTMHWLSEGAFTGETSPTMLTALGCRHVLLGHSEQRMYFGETYDRVNLKFKAAVAHGISPIVCIGEQLAEREDGQTEATLREQVRTTLRNVTHAEAAHLILAYEPIWAIGTGRTATPDVAQEAHSIIRDELAACCGAGLAAEIRILYGGSVKPDNVSALMTEADIDGALVGGASLDPAGFAKIVTYEA